MDINPGLTKLFDADMDFQVLDWMFYILIYRWILHSLLKIMMY